MAKMRTVLTPIAPTTTAVRSIDLYGGGSVTIKGEDAWSGSSGVIVENVLARDLALREFRQEMAEKESRARAEAQRRAEQQQRALEQQKVAEQQRKKQIIIFGKKQGAVGVITPIPQKRITLREEKKQVPVRTLEPEDFRTEVAEAIKGGKKVEFIPEGVRVTEGVVTEPSTGFQKFITSIFQVLAYRQEEELIITG